MVGPDRPAAHHQHNAGISWAVAQQHEVVTFFSFCFFVVSFSLFSFSKYEYL
jgi:hypothetical protein